MARPSDYRETCTIKTDVAYREANKSGETQASEGVLRPGRVVWARAHSGGNPSSDQVTVYAEGIGLVDLPAEALSQNH